jgi:type IV secretory pathway VirB10-like protein
MALGGATHLHILVTRHGHSHQPPESATAGTPNPHPHPHPHPADPEGISAAETTAPRPQDESAAAIAPRKTATSTPASRNVRSAKPRSRASDGTGRPGRRADASIDELTAVIANAHPDSGQVSRANARGALQTAGLSAGNDRIAEALTHLAQAHATDPEPPTE